MTEISTIETIEIEINTIEMTEIMEMITLIEEIEVIKTRWVDKETEMIIIGFLVIKDAITHIIISVDEYLDVLSIWWMYLFFKLEG